jgi:hypothetical protein
VSLGQNGCGSLDRRGNSALRHIDEGLSNEALPTLNIEEEKMNNEQKRHIWLIIGISFWAGIGLMSIINIIKTVYNQHALLYDWIMFAVSIILISISLVYLIILKKNRQVF